MNLGRRYECCVHDYLVKVHGPAARDLVAEFESDWNSAGPAEAVLDPPTRWEPPVAPGAGKATVVVTSRREADRAQEIRRALTALVADAKREIVFAYPYFSDDTFVAQLEVAVRRGVRVRAIFPAETDEAVMRILNPLNANQLWKGGGEIRIYDSRFSHSKYLFVDAQKALLGSSNADAITFKFNQEAGLLVEDAAFVAEALARLAETDWNASRPPRYADLHLPWYQAPKGALYELFDFVM
jgi:cardiolipin synthase